MSRYVLKSDGNETTFVGWDNPLQTFFAQTYRYFDEPEEELVWVIGDSFGALPTPGKFVLKLEQCGFDVPYGMYEQLKVDFAERKELTPLQKMVQEMFSTVNKP